jgi:limonene-1,2-epoxide hydrolase
MDQAAATRDATTIRVEHGPLAPLAGNRTASSSARAMRAAGGYRNKDPASLEFNWGIDRKGVRQWWALYASILPSGVRGYISAQIGSSTLSSREKRMNDLPESIVRGLLALWGDPQPEKLAGFFAEDAVWVDGPNGVHRGAKAIVEELARQLSIFPGQWVEVDTLIARAGTVMVEWHGGFSAGGTTIRTRVMAVFEVDASGRIRQMRESFDMKSLTDQLKAAGFAAPR